jgi:predicted permease
MKPAEVNCSKERGFHWLEFLLMDIRYAVRVLSKSPEFTIVAILTLALGIGANTAIFSVVERVVLSPLPYRNPDHLVMVLLNNLTLKHNTMLSYPDFLDWQRHSRSFEQMAGYIKLDYDITNPGPPQHIDGNAISSGFFSTLGIKPSLGREFSPQEDQHGGPPVVIISDSLWKNRFAGSKSAIGRSIVLSGVDYTVVGILPPQFFFWSNADVFTPIGQGDQRELNSRTVHDVICIARLQTNVGIVAAQAEMSTIQENISKLYPAAERGLGISVLPLKQQLVGDVRGILFFLLGAVGLVLLIACANVANLLLARSVVRAREFAIRAALGANRSRILSQLFTESILLSLVGGGLGLLVAVVGLRVVPTTITAGLPRIENIHLNMSVLLFAFGSSIGVGILFGFAPAFQITRRALHSSLKQGGRGSSGAYNSVQTALVTVQMALALILLAGAGLLFRTIRHLGSVNPGFDASHIVTFKVGLSPSVTSIGPSVRTAYEQLLDRTRQIPGVRAADLTTLVPLTRQDNSIPFWIDSAKPDSVAKAPRLLGYATGSDYLRVMGIPLVRGRFFNQSDTANSALVVVIDTVLAHNYFPNEDPIGHTISYPSYGPYRIIGVVGHVQHWGLGNSDVGTQNQAYADFYQISDQWMPGIDVSTTLVLRTPLDIATIMPSIKAVVYGTGGDQPIYKVKAIEDIVSESMSTQRLPMILLGTFAGLALLLACIGIYGVISYLGAQRVQEIGIRMTFGADRGHIFRMVIWQGLRLALAGVLTGGAIALILARLISSFSRLLYGVGASDPVTFAAASLLLTAVAVLACYVPAHRAMRVDPLVALRNE